jgi:nucleolar pre-ribosomal-associated protein 1
MSLYNSPNLPDNCSQKILHIIYRTTLIGGATTLVTRCGVLSWLKEVLTSSRHTDKELLSCLKYKVQKLCDTEKVAVWSNGNIRLDNQGGSI